MIKYAFCTLIAVFVLGGVAHGEEFLGVPVMDQARILEQTKDRFEFKTEKSHSQALAFYRDYIKELPDIKVREWKDATYIEDDGKLPWHSITISKGEPEETTVVIIKDNWTWIIGTLVLRFVGVFVVLMILFLVMTLSGKIARFFESPASEKSPG